MVLDETQLDSEASTLNSQPAEDINDRTIDRGTCDISSANPSPSSTSRDNEEVNFEMGGEDTPQQREDYMQLDVASVTLEEPDYEQLRLDRQERTRSSMRVSCVYHILLVLLHIGNKTSGWVHFTNIALKFKGCLRGYKWGFPCIKGEICLDSV